MDAEHRHELKTNELANLMLKLKDWADKYLNTVLTIVAVAALAWAAYRFWSWRQENALSSAWAEVSRANVRDTTAGEAPLDQLRRVAREAPDATIAAIARIRLAAGLMERAEDAGGDARLSEAVTELRSVVSSSVADSLKAAALFQLAGAYEGQRDLAHARESYEQLVNGPQYESLPFTALATDRLKTIDELTQRVELLPGSPPAAAVPSLEDLIPSSRPIPAADGPLAPSPSISPIAPVPPPATQPASQPAPASAPDKPT